MKGVWGGGHRSYMLEWVVAQVMANVAAGLRRREPSFIILVLAWMDISWV